MTLGGPSVPSVTLYSQARACERSREASPPFGSRSLPQIPQRHAAKNIKLKSESAGALRRDG